MKFVRSGLFASLLICSGVYALNHESQEFQQLKTDVYTDMDTVLSEFSDQSMMLHVFLNVMSSQLDKFVSDYVVQREFYGAKKDFLTLLHVFYTHPVCVDLAPGGDYVHMQESIENMSRELIRVKSRMLMLQRAVSNCERHIMWGEALNTYGTLEKIKQEIDFSDDAMNNFQNKMDEHNIADTIRHATNQLFGVFKKRKKIASYLNETTRDHVNAFTEEFDDALHMDASDRLPCQDDKEFDIVDALCYKTFEWHAHTMFKDSLKLHKVELLEKKRDVIMACLLYDVLYTWVEDHVGDDYITQLFDWNGKVIEKNERCDHWLPCPSEYYKHIFQA